AVWKCLAFRTPGWRAPASTASATRAARAMLCFSFIGFHRTPSANWFFWPTPDQTHLGYLGSASRFITTEPTSTMPSSLERLDSKYVTLVVHGVGDRAAKGEKIAQPAGAGMSRRAAGSRRRVLTIGDSRARYISGGRAGRRSRQSGASALRLR